VKAAAGGKGLDQGRRLEVRDQHEDVHVHGEPGRAIVAVSDRAAVGAAELEAVEDVLQPVNDVDEPRVVHPSLSATAW
jgi:hypothetical protein